METILRDLGFNRYEFRAFDNALVDYVELREVYELTHTEACNEMPVYSDTWREALATVYREMCDNPELYW